MLFGGLHIEMAALRSVGSMLQDSGWTDALTEAQVASSGTVQSFLSASSVTRTRQAHQVTLSALYRLKKNAYDHYITDESESSPRLEFAMWCEKRKKESPQFCYWDLIMSMELVILALIRSFREGDFELY